MPLANVHHPLL